MAKITLRAYNRQIEALIDREEFQEAIAHCRHILGVFPKHVATYRLLGKAYLEAHRHREAADVFRRVLAAVPDDFISHAALSVIHEEAGDLKTALWHMERAFEVQPANPAIQDELRRLYEAVEGVAPPRLRLTRGALARMYLRNGLYAQAVAELRSALADEPNRADLMVLLAKALYEEGQSVEAVGVAASLLKKLPYCMEANRLMAVVLEETGRKDDAERYWKRLYMLDPYEAFRTSVVTSAKEVPDEAVVLDRLVWTPDMALADDGLAAPLASIAAEEDEALPSWFETSEEESGEIPAEEAPVAEAESDEEDLVAADLPEWLQELAPEDLVTDGAVSPDAEDELDADIDEEMAALLAGGTLGVAAEVSAAAVEEAPAAPADEDDALAWLEGLAARQGAAEEELLTAPEDRVETPPAWVEETAEEAAEEVAASAEAVETVSAEQTATSEVAEAAEDALPEWLQEVAETGAVAEADDDLPAWLQAEDVTAETAPEPAAETLAAEVEETPAAPADEDDALAWLEGLAARQGVAEEELLTAPEDRVETPPAWVEETAEEAAEEVAASVEAVETVSAEQTATSEAAEDALPEWLQEVAETGAVAEADDDLPAWLQAEDVAAEIAPEPATETPAAEVEEAPAAPADEDDALAWLEGLAARQGAAEEELLTAPENRVETPPAWVEEAAEEAAEEVAASVEAVETASAEQAATSEAVEAVEDALPEWLQKAGEEAGITAEADDALSAWLQEKAAVEDITPEPVAEAPAAEVEQPVSGEAAAEDVLPEWLQEVVEADAVAETDDDLSAWLQEKAAVEDITPEPVAEAPAAEVEQPVSGEAAAEDALPGWLQKAGEEAGITAEADDDLSAWLQEKAAAEDITPEPAAETPAAEVEEAPAAPADEDDAMAWLEGLAARQGAAEEELLTAPEDRVETPPTWVEEAAEEAAEEIAAAVEAEAAPEAEAAAEAVTEEIKETSEEAEASLPAAEEAVTVVKEAKATAPFFDRQTEVETEPSQPEPAEVVAETEGHPAETAAFSQTASATAEAPSADHALRPSKPKTGKEDRYAIWLAQARETLASGDLPGALKTYTKLIRKKRYLEVIVTDLEEALARYPVDVDVWQTLGDAYMRQGRLQDALEAYDKAESLLR